MTKTLTEQWCEGKLLDGAYYIIVDKYEQNKPEIDVGICYNSNFEWWIVKEVLAPVPSYEEWQSCDKCADMLIDVNKKWGKTIKERKQLKKKLEIATKALKEIERIKVGKENNFSILIAHSYSKEALKEMEGVK